jgi:glycosyltransferase involved in cell wall biosynthesis
MHIPTVSILIPTFNRAHYVGDAITSALKQTLTDTEVIVVDDGSSDRTPEIIAAFDDPRLRLVRHEINRGIPETRNTALAAARGQYIAWLDSDDVARPTRIRKQVDFLRDNPIIAMVGSAAGKMNADGTPKKGIRMPPLSPPMIAAWLLFRSAFQQSSIMGRAEILKSYRYDPRYRVCEDVDLFVRLQHDHRLANLPEILIDRRMHPDQTVRQFRSEILTSREMLIAPTLAALSIRNSCPGPATGCPGCDARTTLRTCSIRARSIRRATISGFLPAARWHRRSDAPRRSRPLPRDCRPACSAQMQGDG